MSLALTHGRTSVGRIVPSMLRPQHICKTLSNSAAILYARSKSTQPQHESETAKEYINFPSSSSNSKDAPVLLNAKEHAIGYLSKILNARVYEAAIETKLQYAHNLSAVSA